MNHTDKNMSKNRIPATSNKHKCCEDDATIPTHLGERCSRVVHDGVEVIALAQGVDLFRRQLVEVVVLTLHGEGERSEVSHQVVQTTEFQLY